MFGFRFRLQRESVELDPLEQLALEKYFHWEVEPGLNEIKIINRELADHIVEEGRLAGKLIKIEWAVMHGAIVLHRALKKMRAVASRPVPRGERKPHYGTYD